MVLFLVASQARGTDLPVGPAQPYLTFGEAWAAALSGDRLVVDPGAYLEPPLELDAAKVLEVVAAAGPGTVVLRGTGTSVFEVRGGARLAVLELEVDGEGERRLALVEGGAALAVTGCDVHDTSSGNPSREGGAVYVTGAELTVTGSTFSTSTTRRRGGFLSLSSGAVAVVSGSTFTGGHADRDGGAIALDAGSTLLVDGSSFEANTADRDGSALTIEAGTVALTGVTFTGNTTNGRGTVRCESAIGCDVADSTFDGNLAGEGGAALSARGGAASLVRSTVCRSSGGSAVLLEGATGTVTNTVLLSNDLDGAMILVEDDASATIRNNTFAGNASGGVGTAVRVLGTADLVNNLVAWSDGPVAAVAAGALATATGGYQAYWQNVAIDTDLPLPNDLLGLDPLVLEPPGGTCDATALVPPATSPLVDAGDPTLLDADGSPSDIGAWGGQAAAEPVDADGDGWYAGSDCDETDPAVHPGQAEAGCNGTDDDCDPSTLDDGDGDADGVTICQGDCDDADPARSASGPRFADADGDGFGVGEAFQVCGAPAATSAVGGDCDDADPTAFPGAEDVAYDAVDQDCDGADLDDLDRDGSLGADDCDDEDPARSPERDEVPDDGVDQDCTGTDASATLNGGAGARCGCETGAGGAPFGLLLGLLIRRRRA